jgi:hypothetical protein
MGNYHLQFDKNELFQINTNDSKSIDSLKIKRISQEYIMTLDGETIDYEEIKDVRLLLWILAYTEKWQNKKSNDFIQIEWGIIDFESRASNLEEKYGNSRVIYDRSKFSFGLKMLEEMHDYSLGICWGDIDYILNEYCRLS